MRLVPFLMLGLTLCDLHTLALAQLEKEVFIYKGEPVSQSGITIGGWGSGKAGESKEHILTGGNSIKMTIQGLYSGARLDFAQPVTLFSDGVADTRYLMLTLYFADLQTVDPAAETNYALDVSPYTIPKVNRVRLVFVSNNNEKLSVEEPTNPVDPDDNWVRIAVPLAKFRKAGFDKSFSLKRLLFFTDIPSTVYLGEIKLVSDDTPIKVDPLGTQTVAVYDEVFFVASATGGVSSLRYAWDFDDSNGIQAEVTGPIGRFVYTRGGDFKVTVVVSDADGIKKEAVATGSVSVID
jgi:hypothetical protein